jgi:intein-encoded DNA endonuclease-like protein
VEILEFQPGAVRCSLKALPSYLPKLKQTKQAHYIAGLYDAEGHIKKRQVEIDFSITSKPVWKFIQAFLKTTAIQYSPLVRERKGRKKIFEIYIYGKKDVRNFVKTIPIQHPAKVKILNEKLAPR